MIRVQVCGRQRHSRRDFNNTFTFFKESRAKKELNEQQCKNLSSINDLDKSVQSKLKSTKHERNRSINKGYIS